ncbi:MAG: phenol hydroxylase subunit [Sneathiella sp.]
MIENAPRQDGAIGQAFVRVTGTRNDAFVEFEFSINDEDLMVELIMPFKEFENFCRKENAAVLPPDDTVRSEVDKFFHRQKNAWRLTSVD